MMKLKLNWLLNNRITNVTFDEETYCWKFGLSNGGVLAVFCPWQILADGRVKLASQDHGQFYGLSSPIDGVSLATELVSNRKITKIDLHEISSDLTIEIEGEIVLRTFNDSSGFEAWDLNDPIEGEYIAQGGGNIEVFGR